MNTEQLKEENERLRAELAESNEQMRRVKSALGLDADECAETSANDAEEFLRKLLRERSTLRVELKQAQKERDEALTFGEKVHEEMERRTVVMEERLRAAIVDLTSAQQEAARLREALKACHPAHVWDMARQHYTAPEVTYPNVITEWHHALCKQADAALSPQPEQPAQPQSDHGEKCPSCGRGIEAGAQVYLCEACKEECCTPCSHTTEEHAVICDDCHSQQPAQQAEGGG